MTKRPTKAQIATVAKVVKYYEKVASKTCQKIQTDDSWALWSAMNTLVEILKDKHGPEKHWEGITNEYKERHGST